MELKVKSRLDLVQTIIEIMNTAAEKIRGQATVGYVQVMLRLAEGAVNVQELGKYLDEDEEDITESLEIMEEFGIVDVVNSSIPSYEYLGYPEEIKFLITDRPVVINALEEAIIAIESLLEHQTAQTDEETNDLIVLKDMASQMRKDYGIK